MPLNIQFFADGGEEGAEGQGEEQKPTFEDILKDKEMQSAFDKKVTKALETARSKWETDYTTKLEQAKSEAEKLSKMKAEEKAQYELDKKQKELDEKLKAISLRELKAEAITQLSESGLSKDFADLLNYENADTVKNSIDNISKVFAKAVETEVAKKLGSQEAPRKGGGTTITTADEAYKAFLENPSQELWDKYQKLLNK